MTLTEGRADARAELDAKIYAARAARKPWKDIAAAFGISVHAARRGAIRHAGKHGLEMPHIPDRPSPNAERDRNIVAFLKDGHTLEEAGQHFGVTRERIRQIALKLGYKDRVGHPRRGADPVSTVCDAQLYAARKTGMTWLEIARKFDISSPQYASVVAGRHAKRNGLQWPIDRPNWTRRAAREGPRFPERDAAIFRARKAGACWADIAKDFETKIPTAILAAQNHAERHALEWPKFERRGRGKDAYAARQAGKDWTEIASLTGLSCGMSASNSAREYARRHGLQWPVKMRET